MTSAKDAKKAAVTAALSIAEDVVAGTLNPAQLDAVAVEECRELFATVVGPDDPLWDLQVEVARGVLAADGIPADELAEWLAVTRTAQGVPVVPAEPSWIEQALALGPDCICPPSTAGGLAVDCPVHDEDVSRN